MAWKGILAVLFADFIRTQHDIMEEKAEEEMGSCVP